MGSQGQADNFFEGAGFDWESYIVHRPAPTPEFYQLIYDHHRAHGGEFNLAHDIGTGPGNIAEQIGKTFKHVHASEPSAYHTSVAEHRLKAIDPHKYTTQQCRGEDISSEAAGHKEGSVDLITVAQCIPLMNVPQAISGFAHLLKPATGTLAIWFYGRPCFADPAQHKSQQIINAIISKAWDRVRPMKGTGFEPAKTMLCAFLDNVAFPPEQWQHVRRLKWNADKPMMFLENDDVDFEIRWESAVGEGEVEERYLDRGFWAVEADVAWMRGFVDYALPWENKDEEKRGFDGLFGELEQAMGGKGVRQRVTWPVALLLATRK
ncbi:MAG: hypothetical protein L6R37_006391 [Teloschistes peruensis]|nr:MAG: hypothetical protein L6R37_006391 [Teloschistes peruensis]